MLKLYPKRFVFLAASVCCTMLSVAVAQDFRDLNQPMRPDSTHPLFMALMSNNCYRTLQPQLWEKMYPEELKPHMAIEICNLGDYEKKFEYCTQQKIPVIYRVRSVWPIEQITPMALDFMEDVLKRYPIIRGLACSELMNARFTKEERDYVCNVIELCRKYDRLFIWNEAAGGASPFMQIGSDSKLRKTVQDNKDRVILMQEAVDGTLQMLNVNAILGLQRAGIIDQWGFNPQLFYWQGSGFTTLGQQSPARDGKREDMPPSAYSQLMMNAAMTNGASSFYFGGERAPHYFDAQFLPTEVWHATWPFIKELISGKVIPTQEEVNQNIHMLIQGGTDQIAATTNELAHKGKNSVMLRGGLEKVSWSQENWVPIEKGKSYRFIGWMFVKNASADIAPELEVIFYDRNPTTHWPYVGKEAKKLSFTKINQWNRFEWTLTPPDKVTDMLLVLSLTIKAGARGEYYFDDWRIVDDAGHDLVNNGSFEELDLGNGEPIGWASSFKKSLANTADFGLPGKFYNKIYDLHGQGDMYVETAKWGVVPMMPQCWQPAGTPWEKQLIHLDPWDEAAIQQRLQTPADADAQGTRAQYPGRLWLSNSSENTGEIQHLSGHVDTLQIEADLGSEAHLLAVKHENTFHLLVSGRQEKHSRVTLLSPFAFAVAQADQTWQAGQTNGRYECTLDVDHSQTTTHSYIIQP